MTTSSSTTSTHRTPCPVLQVPKPASSPINSPNMALMTHRAPSSSTLHSYSASTSCAAPPPTCNLLDAAQRTRLIKSSRKLGKMLGATPYVLEEDEPRESCSTSSSSRSASPALKAKRSSDTVAHPSVSFDFSYARSRMQTPTLSRSRSASGASTATGTSEADSTAAFFSQPYLSRRESLAPPPAPATLGRQSNAQRQPVLRIPALVASSKSELPEAAAPSSPSSTSSSPSSPRLPASPITPSGSSTSLTALSEVEVSDIDLELDYLAVDEARIRKRRMEKLMRHLGECVPSELVFGPSSKSSSTNLRRPTTAPTPADKLDRPLLKQLRRTSVSIITGPPHNPLNRSPSALSGHLMHRTHHQQAVLEDDGELSSFDRAMEGREEGTDVHQLVDDEWTPAAYQDVVKRLRALR